MDEAELAIKSGAWDYLEKPASFEILKLPIIRALEYRAERKSEKPQFVLKRNGIIGDSPKITSCLELLAQAAGSEANVLITGETGTGKELFAKAIHSNSSRAKKILWSLTARRFPRRLLKAFFLGTREVLSPEPNEARRG